MGADESRRRSRVADQRARHLPRHIIEHIGQVLRNRYRGDLLVPLPNEMQAIVERVGQGQVSIQADRE
jgi:hypothetical protein